VGTLWTLGRRWMGTQGDWSPRSPFRGVLQLYSKETFGGDRALLHLDAELRPKKHPFWEFRFIARHLPAQRIRVLKSVALFHWASFYRKPDGTS